MYISLSFLGVYIRMAPTRRLSVQGSFATTRSEEEVIRYFIITSTLPWPSHTFFNKHRLRVLYESDSRRRVDVSVSVWAKSQSVSTGDDGLFSLGISGGMVSLRSGYEPVSVF
jgi:hypothetical protein